MKKNLDINNIEMMKAQELYEKLEFLKYEILNNDK